MLRAAQNFSYLGKEVSMKAKKVSKKTTKSTTKKTAKKRK
jgi:hypothetical protein